jgi:diaminopimelate decarboxylase
MSFEDFQKVLPLTARIGRAGGLEIGNVETAALAREYGTPLFVLDLADVRERAGRYRDSFGGANVFYAAKAFLTKSFASILADEDIGIDCVAGGEVFTALAGGFPASRIAVHGNNKSRAELVACLQAGVGRIVVDSFAELELLRELTKEMETVVRVLLRVTPGVDVGGHTHTYLATGAEDSKFGFPIGEIAMRAADMVARTEELELVGLHSHIGSQVFDLERDARWSRSSRRCAARRRSRCPSSTSAGAWASRTCRPTSRRGSRISRRCCTTPWGPRRSVCLHPSRR